MLAIDIGASSGRIMKGYTEGGKLKCEELFRFPNGYKKEGDYLVWDYDALFSYIIEGLKTVDKNDRVLSLAIDTWGVDFVLLDKNLKPIGPFVCYRDKRTENIVSPISKEELYKRTGIQYLSFNTIYQLLAIKKSNSEYLEKAKYLLQVPDYLNFLLTGRIESEYTNATTTSLVNAKTKTWDYELIERLGLPKSIFLPLKKAGETIGTLKEEIVKTIGFDTVVIHAASHDTASAVAGMPLNDTSVFLATGTWSLLGAEIKEPIVTEESYNANFSNEGGVNNTIRYLKNISGLFIFQQLKKETSLSYDEIEDRARKRLDTEKVVDLTDERFISPISMKNELIAAIGEEVEDEELFAICYKSLTACYKNAIEHLKALVGINFSNIVIVGGGTKDQLLLSLLEKELHLKVVKGNSEGTTMGNLIVQLLANKKIKNIEEGRKMVC